MRSAGLRDLAYLAESRSYDVCVPIKLTSKQTFNLSLMCQQRPTAPHQNRCQLRLRLYAHAASETASGLLLKPSVRASAASVSLTRRRIISATGSISLMPPAVCPAVSKHSCWRPASGCHDNVDFAAGRARGRASSRLALHSVKNGVGRRSQNGLVAKGAGNWANVIEHVHLHNVFRLGVYDGLFPFLRRWCLLRCNRSGAEIDANGAQHQRSRDAATIENTPGGDDGYWRHCVDDLGHQRHGADVPAIAARIHRPVR